MTINTGNTQVAPPSNGVSGGIGQVAPPSNGVSGGIGDKIIF
jgi:hypothetical protein